MSLVRVTQLSLSLDGYATGEGQSLEEPFGHAGERLHHWEHSRPPGAACVRQWRVALAYDVTPERSTTR